MNYLVGGDVPQRLGNAHPNAVPYRDLATTDEYGMVTCGSNDRFEALCSLMRVLAGHDIGD